MGAAAAGLVVGAGSSCQQSPAANRVALSREASYETESLKQTLAGMFDSIGGLDGIIRSGDWVALKINLTGGTPTADLLKAKFGLPPGEGHWTHPNVVRAAGELVRDAGAGRISIIDGLFDGPSFSNYGYSDVAAYLGAELIDLNFPAPYGSFITRPVGAGWMAYEHFVFNQILNDINCLFSIAKMKCHQHAGVTLGLKNLFGLVPASAYRLDPGDIFRSALHGAGNQYQERISRVIVDLGRARPMQFSIIDGIKTIEAGEGPWSPTAMPVAPGVLLAGHDPVAVDAAAMAVMGFDPQAAALAAPFLNGENHLALASRHGLGSNRLEDIEIAGEKVADVRFPFSPCLKLSV